MLYQDRDPFEQIQEVARRAESISFLTHPDIRTDLTVASISFLEGFRAGVKIDPTFEKVAENPIGIVADLLVQLDERDGDFLRLDFTGEMLDMANALYLRHIAMHKEVLPELVARKEHLLDRLNQDYRRFGGVGSPIYADHLGEREGL